MAKQRGYRPPGRRKRRSRDGKKSFAQRIMERKLVNPEPVQVTGFKSFLEIVWGKAPSEAEFANAKKQTNRFTKELDNPKIPLKRLREIYNQMAGQYLKIIAPLRIEAEIHVISNRVKLRPNSKIASLCSGTSILEAFFAKKIVPQGKVTCVDISPEMNKIAEIVRARAKAENMDILTRSATTTGLAASSQDLVIMMQPGINETIHWQPILTEVKRIIKKGPNARFAVSFFTTKKKDTLDVIQSLKRNGFDGVVREYANTPKEKAVIAIARYVPI